MLANVTFYNDQELPTTDLIWTKPDGTSLYDFSSGWTFSLRLARVTAPATTVLLKTTGITGAATSPNLSIAWSTSDWSGLEASTNGTKYVGAVYARRTADSYDMAANISVTLKAAPGTSAVSPSSYPITVTAASVTFTPSGSLTATDAQAAITEASTDLDAHLADTVDAHDASAISFTPTGTIAATDVQAALAEIASDAATAASTTVSGIVELATDAEALARTDAVRTVTPANLAQFTTLNRHSGDRMIPTAAIAQTIPRWMARTGNSTLLSGRQAFVAIWLPLGVTVSSITFFSNSVAAVTPTNQWFSLYDQNRNKLRVTNDDTTTPWPVSTAKTLSLSSSYTTTYEGIHYVGILVAATTVPTLTGSDAPSLIGSLAPVSWGSDATNTGLTTPATAPATAAALTANTGCSYAYVS